MVRKSAPTSVTDVLRRLPAPLFTAADAAKLVANENVFLYRAGKKGYVRKIANRIYRNVLFSPQPPPAEQVACFARRPSYVSCEWALNHHGVLLQVPTVCTAVTLHGSTGRRNRIVYEGVVIEYSRIAARLYLPEAVEAMDGVFMATAAKALLDTIYLRHRPPLADELEMEAVDPDALRSLAARYPPYVGRQVRALHERV